MADWSGTITALGVLGAVVWAILGYLVAGRNEDGMRELGMASWYCWLVGFGTLMTAMFWSSVCRALGAILELLSSE